MAAVSDVFSALNNATLERFYQITSAGTAQDITGWTLHSQWRYIDGTLGLDLTLENGLIQIVDAPSGQWKFFIQPADLASLTAGTLNFDLLAIPPSSSGLAPRVYCPLVGAASIGVGSTLAGIA